MPRFTFEGNAGIRNIEVTLSAGRGWAASPETAVNNLVGLGETGGNPGINEVSGMLRRCG